MLNAETNELLTRVGPSTPMGDYLRHYWHPIGGEAEIAKPGVRPVRLLGEDLVLYRDLSGTLGLVERQCPHRRADLSYGYVESCGLRCSYHGWLFSETGKCLEQPFEDQVNPRAAFRDKVSLVSYPVRAFAGMIWAYLGPLPAPELPDWEPFSWSNGFRHVLMAEVPCNWLQCQENLMDPVHLEWLHTNWSIRQSGRTGPYGPKTLKIDFEEFEFGYQYKRLTEGASETDELWTTGRAALWPNGFFAGEHLDWHTPVDDYTTLRVTWAFARVPSEREPYHQDQPLPCWRGPVRDADGRWLTERPGNQDYVAWVGQGAISDRTKEHLGVSDRGVILYRRKLQEELKSLAEGGVPKGLITDPQRNCRVPLPGTLRDVHMNGLPRDELLSHPFLGGLFRFGYPFQSGEPTELRAAFEDAMCLNPGWDSHLQAQDAAE